jgi:hypothetical protein
MSDPNPNPYPSRKTGTLAPTDGIKDPQVRAFCDALANAWHLRNGSIGHDDKERFITKQEWDFLAKNPNILAIIGIGQPGSSVSGDGSSGGGDSNTQNLINFLNSGITLIDFGKIREGGNKLWASIYALTTDVRNKISDVNGILSGLQDDITQINTIESTSTSKSAQTLFAVKEEMGDATAAIIEINNVSVTSTSANAKQTALTVARVDDNQAAIIQINTVSADSTSANAQRLVGVSASIGYNPATGEAKATADIAALEDVTVDSKSANARMTAGMYAQFIDPASGLGAAFAAINEINYVSADSKSANARQLSGTMVGVGLKSKVFAQMTPPYSDANYTLKLNDIWIHTGNNNKMYRWDGLAWVPADDMRIAFSLAGVTHETETRVTSDSALVKAINNIWAQVGNDTALVQDTGNVVVFPGNAHANYFTDVQAAVTDYTKVPPQVYSAASKESFEAEVSLADRRAHAGYSLQVDARGVDSTGKPVFAIAGMKLTADVLDGKPSTECVFLVDKFAIYNPALPYAWAAPFAIEGGIVRMNITHIKQHIQSDLFFPPGQGGYEHGRGWKIDYLGNAEFYGTTFLARMYSGSTLVDRHSGQIMGTTAVHSWSAFGVSGATQHYSDSLRFWGPNGHLNVDPYHRIRATNWSGIGLACTVQFMGVADDRITLWASYRNGPWEPLNTTITPSDDYNAATCGWSGIRYCDPDGYWLFAVSPTDGALSPGNSSKVDLRNFTLTVTMSNL